MYFTVNMRRCIFLFSLVFVVVCAQTSIPPLTLLGNKSKKELHCVIANDTSDSAITFVGQDIIDHTKYEPPPNLCKEDNDPFGCFNSTQQNHMYMRQLNSFAGYVLDRRWEGFRTLKTSGDYTFTNVVGIPTSNFTLAFSVRLKENGHILLCDDKYPPNSTCYWWILEGWGSKNTRTVIRRCEKEIPIEDNVYPQNCKMAVKYISGLTNESKWSHFRLEFRASVISLYKYGDDDPILTYIDSQPIQLKYLTFRSPGNQGLWKIHQHDFMEMTGDMTITTTSLHLPNGSHSVCVAVYLKLCSGCKANIALLNGKSTLTEITPANIKANSWTEIQLKTKQTTGDQLTVRIKASQAMGKKWYLGEIFECVPNGIHKITTDYKNSENDICCHVIKSGQTICTKKSLDRLSSSPAPERDCPPNTIGRHCIPCDLFGGCDFYKYCEFGSHTKIQCHCPRGFKASDCRQMCSPGKYGDLCLESCNRCADESRCSHINGRCQSGCKDNLVGEFCQSYDKPVLKHSPEISAGYTSVTFKINPEYDGKVAPAFFKIQLKPLNGNWMEYKSEKFSIQPNLVIINDLTRDTFYYVRILLQTMSGDVYAEEIYIPTANFTTTCAELSREKINVIVKGQYIGIVNKGSPETCNISNYRYDLGYHLRINHTIPHLTMCALNNIKIINMNSKHSFNFSVKTGENNNDPIQCLSEEVTQNSAILKWDYHGDNDVKYQISYQEKKQELIKCNHNYDSEWKTSTTVVTNVSLNNLHPYRSYIVRVTPVREDNGNHEQFKNIEFKTPASDTFGEESIKLLRKQNNIDLNVIAQLEDCTKVTGPIDFSLELKCESTWCVLDKPQMREESNFVFDKGFHFLITGFTDYTLLATIRRKTSEKKTPLRFTTNETAPGPVLDPLIYSKTNQDMSFSWKPPYPPMGKLQYYEIKYYSTSGYFPSLNRENSKRCYPKECPLYPEYHCCSINGLSYDNEYIVKVCAINEKPNICGQGIQMKGQTRQAKPEIPAYIDLKWENYQNLTVEFPHPRITNGPLTSYSIYIDGTAYTTNIYEELPIYTHKLLTIEPAKVINVGLSVTNSAGTSDFVQNVTTSPPPTPKRPKVLNIEATNFTIVIPTFKRPNEVTFSILIFVIDTNSNGGPTGKEKTIFQDYGIDNHGHRSWIAVDTTLNDTKDDWKIMIGTADISESIHTRENVHNYKLTSDTEYQIIINITTTFRNVSRIAKYEYTEKTKSSLYVEENGSNLYLLALIILPVICVICFIVLRRRGIKITMPTQFIFRNTENTSNHSNMPLTAITPHQPQRPKVVKDQPAIYQNAIEAQEEDGQFSRIVKISELEQYVKNSLEKNEFERQHALFPRGQTKPWVYGMKPENKKKNRYINLAAYDHTRVKLKVINDDPNTDYINANYIDGYNHPKAFIATQGPKETTLNDFWRMIWQENVEQIVMIANLVEGGKKKVAKYWPDINETMTFGDISVKYISVDIFADYEERVFSATRNGQQSRRIKQLHFVSWPDHGVPLYPQSLAPFHKRMLAIAPSNKPVVVHCSAGVGRTGTFILCDTCLRMAALEGQVDILHHQFNLREQRPNMVDNVEQYKLVHMVLLQCLIAPNTSILCTEDMTQSVETLLASKEIQKQMKYLETSAWQDDAMKMGSTRQSAVIMPEKNRLRNVLPDECSKVILSPYPITDESTTYINAIRVAGFRDLSKYVVTQYPMKNTVGDFWRLIHQQEITLVVCLNTINKKDPNLPIFYPTEDCQEITPVPYLTVQLVSVDEGTQINTYTFDLVEVKQNTITTKVTLLQLNGWKYENITTDSAEGLLSLYEEANRLGKSSDEVLISCYDGVKASGLFTAMSFVIDKIKLEQECDVCLAVRSVRHSRGEFVRDVNQFKYLYKCALEYVLKFELYSNFRS